MNTEPNNIPSKAPQPWQGSLYHAQKHNDWTPAHTPPVVSPATGQVMAAPVVYAVNPYKNTTCITALVLGLATFLTFGLTGIPAVICGHLALNQCKKGTANQNGVAIAGLALGYLAVGGWALFTTMMLVGTIVGGAGSATS